MRNRNETFRNSFLLLYLIICICNQVLNQYYENTNNNELVPSVVAFNIRTDTSTTKRLSRRQYTIPILSTTTVNSDTVQQPEQTDQQTNLSSISTTGSSNKNLLDVDTAVHARYACKKFLRYDGIDVSKSNTTTSPITTTSSNASTSNPYIVQQAFECINLARLAPSGFNIQPYKLIVVHTIEQKNKLINGVLGPNKQRIQDSDCTILFLADKQCCRTFTYYTNFIKRISSSHTRIPSKRMLRTNLLHITIFSSGLPLPRILSSTITFFSRIVVSIINIITKSFYPMPSLGNAETWTTKQIMLVAMTYMLCCTARGIATIPMEGINSNIIRQQFNIPNRYTIPIIVSTGTAYKNNTASSDIMNRRYPQEDMIFDDTFGQKIMNSNTNIVFG